MPPDYSNIISDYKNSLNGGKISLEHRDYILIKELYHCTPSEIDNEEDRLLDLHFEFLMLERKNEKVLQEKEKQKANVRKQLSK